MDSDKILSKDSSRTSGKSAFGFNIMSARLISDAVRTTLGPKGMDKMIVGKDGNVTVSNDGATILKEMQIENPTAKMIAQVAMSQETEVGDGTTTAVVLAGELLKSAEGLLDKGIHPTIIIKGYRMAHVKSIEILHNIAKKTHKKDKNVMMKIAKTAMTGKGVEDSKDFLSGLVVESFLSADIIDKRLIQVVAIPGASIINSRLIKGAIIAKDKISSQGPMLIKNPKIALFFESIELKEIGTDSKITITSTEQMKDFFEMEEKSSKEIINKITASKANVVICQKGIDDAIVHALAKNNIICYRRIPKKDIEFISKATNARICSNIDELKENHLGKADMFEIREIGNERLSFIESTSKSNAVTLLIRASTVHVAEETKRAVEDAIGDIFCEESNNLVVGGAGACEIELARNLLLYSNSLSGKEQYAVKAFAEAMEIVPKSLAENAGLDSIEIMSKLFLEHNKGNIYFGINVFNGNAMDSLKAGIIEPLKIKTFAIASATEVATMILRIDDIIISPSEINHEITQ